MQRPLRPSASLEASTKVLAEAAKSARTAAAGAEGKASPLFRAHRTYRAKSDKDSNGGSKNGWGLGGGYSLSRQQQVDGEFQFEFLLFDRPVTNDGSSMYANIHKIVALPGWWVVVGKYYRLKKMGPKKPKVCPLQTFLGDFQVRF